MHPGILQTLDRLLHRPDPSGRTGAPELVLTLSPGPDGAFLVHARSAAGETHGRFRIPWGAERRGALGRTIRGTSRNLAAVGFPPVESGSPLDLRAEGGRLFEALFADPEVRSLYDQARATDPEGRLRLRLVLDPGLPEAAPLHTLPWELLTQPGRGDVLALEEGVSVVRTLMVRRPPRAFEPRRRLRVLALLSGAGDLELERERRDLQELARSSSRLEVAVEPASDLAALEAVLLRAQERGRPFHVLHLAGHGDLAPGPEGGVLVWEPPGAGLRRVPGRRLSTLLRRFPDLQLVVLNACRTAELATGPTDPFAGVAAALLQGGVPVVAAVQGKIRDRAAVAFAGSFYRSLAQGRAPEEAMSAARWGLWTSAPEGTEWLKPILFQGASRPGPPRWLVRAAAVLVAALLALSLMAGMQHWRLGARALEGAVEEAKGLVADHRPEEAARLLDRFLSGSSWTAWLPWPAAPREVRAAAHATAALTARDLGQPERAVEHARAATRLEPERAVHHYNLGVLLVRAGRPGEAPTALRRALALDPDLWEAGNELACVWLDLGHPGEARDVLEPLLARHPERPLLHKNLGRALLAQGDALAAVAVLERALELLPRDRWPARAEVTLLLARAAAEGGDGAAACAALRRYRAQDPEGVTGHAAEARNLAERVACPAPVRAPVQAPVQTRGGRRGS